MNFQIAIQIYLQVYVTIFVTMLAAELFVKRFPLTPFSKWWRREVIGVLPPDDPMF